MQQKTRLTAALLAASGSLVTSIPAEAGPPQVEGAKVRHGKATFYWDGDTLIIRTKGRNTIIDYSRFDIPVGSTVNFQQQGKNSRVLNRITSDAPTMIMGTVLSNGRVYFINRAGIVFGKDARIDVGALFAGAGEISNANFMAGRDIMTGMTGRVQNSGVIRAGEVILAGRSVMNDGTIETERGGLVAMVSGDSMTVRRAGSLISVRVAGGATALQDGAGVLNTGTIRAPGGRIVATAGDLTSLAVDLEGTLLAKVIEVDGGANGAVRIAGNIDVTGASNGSRTGGSVQITGKDITVESTANVDASGARGGGTVLIGGDMQGRNSAVRNANTLTVAQGAQVRADATEQGDGGKVIFWSDEFTKYGGFASAMGAGRGGNGGFIEVSGKNHLQYEGVADLRATGTGQSGMLLLDPGFLSIQNSGVGPDILTIATINGQLALGNLTVTTSGASQDSGIAWNATNALAGLNSSSLTLNATQAGAGVVFNSAVNFGLWTGDFNVIAPTGGITVGAALSRPNGGNMSFTAGAGQFIALNNATVSTGAGNINFNSAVQLGTNVTVSAGAGDVFFGDTIAGVGGNRNLTVNSLGTTTFTGSLSSIGALTTNAGGSTIVGGDLSLSGNMQLNDNVTFLAGSHLLSNTGSFTTTFNGFVGGPGDLTISSGTGTVLFNSSVGGNPLAALTINSLGAVTFNSWVEGAMPLVVNTPGVTTFKGQVGSITPLTSINILGGSTVISGGLMSTTGAQNYLAVAMGANGTFNASDITINGAFNRSGSGTRDVVFNSAGTVSLLGATTNLQNITSDAGGTFFVAAPLTISGMLAVNDTLSLGAASVTLGAVTGFQLQNVIGNGNSLTLNSGGATVLNGNVTGVQDFSTNAPGTFSLGGNITATGNISILDAITLAGVGQTRTLTTSGAGTITLGSVNGPNTLALNAGAGAINLNGAIGSVSALDAINVNSSGAVNFNSTVNGATDLTVNTTGLTKFAGIVGGTTALNFVNVSGPVQFSSSGITTTGAQDYGNATLGANTTLTSTGGSDIHFHGTIDGNKTLNSSTTGTTIFDGAVGGGTALTSLTASTGSVLFNGGAVTTTGAQTYGASTLGNNLLLTSTGGSAITFNSTVDGAKDLTTSTTGNTVLNGAVGGMTALASITSGKTVFNNGTVNTTGGQTYGNSTLNAATLLTSTGGGNIHFTGTVNGANTLQSVTGGTTIFDGAVGGSTALTSVTALGAVQMNGPSIRTTGSQDYGNTTLGAALTTLTSTGSGNVWMHGTVGGTGAESLTVNTGGVTTFDGAVTNVNNLTTDAAGSNALNADITAAGAIALNGATNLGGAMRTVTSTGSTVTFGGTVDGATDLVVAAAGTTTFSGAVGSGTALNSIFSGGNTALNGGTFITTGSQLYGNATLGANTVLTSTGGGNLEFKGTLNGARSLTANTAGNTIFGGNVGLVTALTSINVPGAVKMNGGTIRTSGNQTYGNATLGAHTTLTSTSSGAITMNGTVTAVANENLTINTSGTTTFNGDVTAIGDLTTDAAGTNTVNADITAAGAIALNGATNLSGALRTITSTGSTVAFGGPLNGGTDLVVTSAGGTTFGGAVGGVNALNSLLVNGSAAINGGGVTTIGTQDYMGPVTLGSSATLASTGAGSITFNDTVQGTGSQNLTVNTGGTTVFNGDVTSLNSLTTDAPGTNALNADINVAGDVNLNGATDLGGALRTVDAAGNVSFGDTLNGATDLVVNAGGTTTFNGVVGGMTALNSLTVNGSAALNGGAVTTTGNQLYGNTVLGADTLLTSTGAGTITMNGTLDGAFNFATSTGGDTIFNGDVGLVDALASISAPGSVQMNGGTIRTVGNQDYGAIALGGHTVLESTGSGDVTLNGTVTGTGTQNLAITTAGITTFNGDVTGINDLTTDPSGTNAVNADITAAGAIELDGDTLLGGAMRTITSTGGTVSFGGAVDGATDLVVGSANGTTFNGAVGGGTELNSLLVTGTTNINTGTINTMNGQTYDSVALGTSATLQSSSNGNIIFNGVVVGNGTADLVINTGGDTAFNGNVSAVNSVTTDGAGTNTVNGDITAVGAIALNGATTLMGAVRTITSDTGTVNFGGTVDGASDLVVTSAGGTTFDGAVGAGTELASLTVVGGTTLNGGSVATTGAQSLGDTVLGANTTLSSSGGGTIETGSVTGGGNSLDVMTSGDTIFNGTVAGLSTLTTDAGGRTLLGGDIDASGDINLLDEVMLLAGDHAVTSATGMVMFGDLLDGPGGLTVGSATGTTFTGAVGSTDALANLTVNGDAAFNGGNVDVEGNINLNGATTYGADTAITSNSGTIAVNGDANAGSFHMWFISNMIEFASGITVSGRHITLNGPMHGLGDLAFNASDELEFRGDLTVDGALDLGNATLTVLGGSLSSHGDIAFNGAVEVDGSRTVTVLDGGNAIFFGTVNGTNFQTDELFVKSSGLTAFNAALGDTMRMLRVQTNHPGTIQVAPSANVKFLVYGELIPSGGPSFLFPLGGAELAQSLSTVNESLIALLREGRRTGSVDYQRSLRQILAADLDDKLKRTGTGVAGATGVAADTTEPE